MAALFPAMDLAVLKRGSANSSSSLNAVTRHSATVEPPGLPSCASRISADTMSAHRSPPGAPPGSPPDAARPAAARPAAARLAAAQHADPLAQQRDFDGQILASIVLLSEYPLHRSPQFSAAAPAAPDVAAFKAHVRFFRPSDYSDLVEERNVNDLCGYVLCPNPRRQLGPGGQWKITATDIVRRKDIEMWCSDRCARRALFVQVQLNESAAWERAGNAGIQVDLLDDDTAAEPDVDRTARRLGQMRLHDQRHAARDAAALALERGERGVASGPGKVNVSLVDKDTQALSPPASAPVPHDSHLLVEGHRTQLPFRPR